MEPRSSGTVRRSRRAPRFRKRPAARPDGNAGIGETLLPIGNVQQFVVTSGSQSEPALLLIGTTVAAWDELVERLTGRFVIRYDLRDTGRSTTADPDSPGYTLRDLVPDAVGVLDGLGIARAHVAGLATSGFTAQRLALDHPSRCRLARADRTRPVAPGPVDDDLPEHSPAIMAHFGSAPPADWTDRTSILHGAVATARVFSGAPQFDAAEARAHAAGVLDRSGPHPASARNGLMNTMVAELDGTQRWRERLPEITAPTLVVHGAADPFFRVGNAEALAEEIPGATLRVLDGSARSSPTGHTRRWPRRCSRARRRSPAPGAVSH